MTSPELSNRIQIWRQKSNANTLTIDDMREAVAALRESRMSAAEASASKPRSRTTKAAPRAADDMLKDLL